MRADRLHELTERPLDELIDVRCADRLPCSVAFVADHVCFSACSFVLLLFRRSHRTDVIHLTSVIEKYRQNVIETIDTQNLPTILDDEEKSSKGGGK